MVAEIGVAQGVHLGRAGLGPLLLHEHLVDTVTLGHRESPWHIWKCQLGGRPRAHLRPPPEVSPVCSSTRRPGSVLPGVGLEKVFVRLRGNLTGEGDVGEEERELALDAVEAGCLVLEVELAGVVLQLRPVAVPEESPDATLPLQPAYTLLDRLLEEDLVVRGKARPADGHYEGGILNDIFSMPYNILRCS